MIIVVEDRHDIGTAFVEGLGRHGVSAVRMDRAMYLEWLAVSDNADMAAVEAHVLAGACDRAGLMVRIRQRSTAAVIAINDARSLEDIVQLLASGVDDVVSKPVHIRELLARISAIGRRGEPAREDSADTPIRVFADGRNPLVAGEVLALPRRERRILECLIKAKCAWIGKDQLFNFAYGIFDEALDCSVVESHICRLRKRLRLRLGYDPIESQRFLGYRIAPASNASPVRAGVLENSPGHITELAP
jgi:DNA-binding response OmpR family regulator